MSEPIKLPLPPGTTILFDFTTGEVRTGDYAAMWSEAARAALVWRKRAEELWEAMERIWETTGSFRTADAADVAAAVHDIAHAAISAHHDPEEGRSAC